METTLKSYEYESSLSRNIEGFIAEKRALGFCYNMEAYALKIFDDYWKEEGNQPLPITRDSLLKWMTRRDGESVNYLGKRISCVRLLCEYLNGLGYGCYVPRETFGGEIAVSRILDRTEVRNFMKAVDEYAARAVKPAHKSRMAQEYATIFRMLICCGLRNGEACELKTSDVNLERGTLHISHAKGNKERTVYMPQDLSAYCARYLEKIRTALGFEPYWFFPAWDESGHILKTGLIRQFHARWEETPYASCGKTPTPHSLRHTFVVMVMNQWMEEGVNLDAMLPYLSRQLGHGSPDETFYYYHQVSDAFRIIRKKDRLSKRVIPEASYETQT